MLCLDEGCTLGSLYLYLEISFAVNLLFSIWDKIHDDWRRVLAELESDHEKLKDDDFIEEEIGLKLLDATIRTGGKRTHRFWTAGRVSGLLCAIADRKRTVREEAIRRVQWVQHVQPHHGRQDP